MPKIEIELTPEQIIALEDALNDGIVAAVEALTNDCPELGSIFTRILLLEGFKTLEIRNRSLVPSVRDQA